MARIELKKCPFCGAEVDTVSVKEKDGNLNIEVKRKDTWIPCSERLPEDRDKVLTHDVDGHVRKCEYDAEFKKFRPEFTNYYAMDVSYVTHWMPMPYYDTTTLRRESDRPKSERYICTHCGGVCYFPYGKHRKIWYEYCPCCGREVQYETKP